MGNCDIHRTFGNSQRLEFEIEDIIYQIYTLQHTHM